MLDQTFFSLLYFSTLKSYYFDSFAFGPWIGLFSATSLEAASSFVSSRRNSTAAGVSVAFPTVAGIFASTAVCCWSSSISSTLLSVFVFGCGCMLEISSSLYQRPTFEKQKRKFSTKTNNSFIL